MPEWSNGVVSKTTVSLPGPQVRILLLPPINKKQKFMKYIALLRGINAGGNRRVEMKKLKILLESLGYTNVLTYINSGNVYFESNKKLAVISKNIEKKLKKEFGFDIPTLVKTQTNMQRIINIIPKNWKNDSTQKSDVAYLFKKIDSKKTLGELPIKKEYIDIRYTKGAIYWNVSRENYNKSQLNKIISHKLYQLMTIRNINTARFLAQWTTKKVIKINMLYNHRIKTWSGFICTKK